MPHLRLNALEMNCLGCCPGMWSHPEDQKTAYKTLPYWMNLAQVLERGLFDSLFIADILGVYDVHGGSAHAAFRHGVEFPVQDPFLLVPAMATVTEHLGFGVTGTLSYEPPFSFARRVSTLDHLTGGRFAWNIVTGYLDTAARAFGHAGQLPHDERYTMAEEYMEVMYKLWEGSWEPDAVVADKVRGIFARAEKIHRIRHRGSHFTVEAYHLCEPSPQRTPVLFQAGASTRGRQFAARHAECVFITGLTPRAVRASVEDLRQRAAAAGRNPAELIIYTALAVVTAPTDAEAEARFDDYRRRVDIERTLALFSGYCGVDFAGCTWDSPLRHFHSNAIQTFVEAFTTANPDKVWTLREVAEFLGVGGFGPTIVGGPARIATQMEAWWRETGVDGFNLLPTVLPGDYVDFVNLVVPELQTRGLYKTAYAPGTFREKLYGPGRAHLPANHPAAAYRR